jgi:hypothetical protein
MKSDPISAGIRLVDIGFYSGYEGAMQWILRTIQEDVSIEELEANCREQIEITNEKLRESIRPT